MQSIIEACHSTSYGSVDTKVQQLLIEGYSVSQMLSQLHEVLICMTTITDDQKSVIAERMGVSKPTCCVNQTL